MPLVVVIGRALACSMHPSASWRRLSASGRVLLAAAYVSVQRRDRVGAWSEAETDPC